LHFGSLKNDEICPKVPLLNNSKDDADLASNLHERYPTKNLYC